MAACISPTMVTAAFDAWGPMASSPRWRAQAFAASRVMVGRRPRPSCTFPRESPWGPMAACISPTPVINRIRRVGPDGIITTVAGTVLVGFAG